VPIDARGASDHVCGASGPELLFGGQACRINTNESVTSCSKSRDSEAGRLRKQSEWPPVSVVRSFPMEQTEVGCSVSLP